MTRWFFSETYSCPERQHVLPVCQAYGHSWMIPLHPESQDGWSLAQMVCSQHQVDAARQDHRIIVLPLLFDPSPVPSEVILAYLDKGAQPGMSLAQLLSKLSETEPRFAHQLRIE